MLRKHKKLKRFIITALTIVILGVCAFVVPLKVETVSSAFLLTSHISPDIKLVAHRGLSSLYPENTIPAFEGAAEYGFELVELDIQTTKDGEWIVIHDDDVDHMTDGEGEVKDFTLKEIKALNIDNGSQIEQQGMKGSRLMIPTLRETLDVCKERGILPIIELKGGELKYLPDLKAMLDEYELSDKVTIISFYEEHIEEYRKLDSDIEIMYLATAPTKADIDWCIEHDFGINYSWYCLYKTLPAVLYARAKGLSSGVWTVDIPIVGDFVALLGVDFITTNKILP